MSVRATNSCNTTDFKWIDLCYGPLLQPRECLAVLTLLGSEKYRAASQSKSVYVVTYFWLPDVETPKIQVLKDQIKERLNRM